MVVDDDGVVVGLVSKRKGQRQLLRARRDKDALQEETERLRGDGHGQHQLGGQGEAAGHRPHRPRRRKLLAPEY